MVIRINDKNQNYNNVTKLLVKPMIIPVDNILFASSIPLDVIHEDFNDEI